MLQTPIRYFPIEKGVYEVAPGLQSLGKDERDAHVFQIDSEFSRYRNSKLDCRAERLSKYYCTSEYSPAVSHAVNQFILTRLLKEHSDHFSWTKSGTNGGVLHCELTHETIEVDGNFELVEVQGCNSSSIPYTSAFDALCSQIQEDVAVISRSPDGNDWLSAIHLCSPGHWAAEDKIGKNFFDIHAPVAGIEKVNQAAPSLVGAIINKGPYLRFVWGFGTDNRLNHHPTPPPGVPLEEWRGRSFQRNKSGSPFILRVERQVLWGLPEVQSSLFMIRIYFIDGEEIRQNPKERALLRSGLLSMTPESRVYKGLANCMEEVIEWLDEGT